MYLKMLELHGQGMSYRAIAEHEDIKKDRTTILHHLRAAGIQPHLSTRVPKSFYSEEKMLERERQREEQRKKRMLERKPKKDIDFGPGRCKGCGIKLAEMPDHNNACAPGNYFKRNDLGGNGTGEEMV